MCRFCNRVNSFLSCSHQGAANSSGLSLHEIFLNWPGSCTCFPRRTELNSGYYAACAGLQAQNQALELIATNVANLNTSGYRMQQPMFQSLLATSGADLADPLNRALNDFNVLGGSRTDLTAGSLEHTGNPLDLGIEGGGFFVVQTPGGILYTRNGSFRISTKNQLTTAAGDLVLGEQGPVTLPSGPVTISADGTISANGAVSDKLRLVEFASGSDVVPVGQSYYSAAATAALPAAGSAIRQGMIESANVNPMAAVVSLITAQRQAEMLERAMSVFNTNFDHIAASDLAKV
jgi:flagellar basal-body rod protein FlgF